jgi:hypothetical protein
MTQLCSTYEVVCISDMVKEFILTNNLKVLEMLVAKLETYELLEIHLKDIDLEILLILIHSK